MTLKWNELDEILKEAVTLIKGKLSKVNDIDEIRTHLTTTVGNISEVLRLYEKKFDDYYNQSKPFSNGDAFQDGDDFAKIVRDSFSIGSYLLLRKWAIDYPLNEPKVLKETLSFYVKYFTEDLENWNQNYAQQGWHPDSKEYWEYLVSELAAKVPHQTTTVLSGTPS